MPELKLDLNWNNRISKGQHQPHHLVWLRKDVPMPCLNADSLDWHEKEFDLEGSELRHAYQVMCSMAAEYECMETAAAMLCPTVPVSDAELQAAASCGYNTGKLSAAATIQWLQENYEEADGISLPRSALYNHYLDFCRDSNMEAVNQATFGKIIRAVFVTVRTRRLGTRGQSKYHYYGLTIKDTSSYKDIMINSQRINNLPSGPGKPLHSRTIAQCSLPSGLPVSGVPPGGNPAGGVLLQDFPAISNVTVPPEIREQTSVFLMMYKHHCQRIVDTVLRANFSEVKEFVVHFWQSLPSHIIGVLTQQVIVDLIILCDTILYRAICALLVPSLLQPLPASLATAIRGFADDLLGWLQEALKSQPKLLRKRKLAVAKSYSASLKRQTTVSHMASMARNFLHSSEMIHKLQDDWQYLSIKSFIAEAQSSLQLHDPKVWEAFQKYLMEFGRLLNQQTTIDCYMEWLRTIINQCVFQRCKEDMNKEKGGTDIMSKGRQFVMTWIQACRIIIRDLTLDNAEMFGAYHLLSLLFQDYILCLLEEHQRDQMYERLRIVVYGEELANTLAQKKDDSTVIQPDSPPSSWTTTYPTPRNTGNNAAPPAKQPLPWEVEPEFPPINLTHSLAAGECLTKCHGQVDKDIMIYRPSDAVASSDVSEMSNSMHSCSFAGSHVISPQATQGPSRNLPSSMPYKPTSLNKSSSAAGISSGIEWAACTGKIKNDHSSLSFSEYVRGKSLSRNPNSWWEKDFYATCHTDSWEPRISAAPGESFRDHPLLVPNSRNASDGLYHSPPYHASLHAEQIQATKSLIGVSPDHVESIKKLANLTTSTNTASHDKWVGERETTGNVLISSSCDISHFQPSQPRFLTYHQPSKLGSINVV